MTRIDCDDAFYGWGFETGALVEISGCLWDSHLCVRLPHKREMRIYAIQHASQRED